MATMERIDVWQLMMGGGKAVNVFVVRPYAASLLFSRFLPLFALLIDILYPLNDANSCLKSGHP